MGTESKLPQSLPNAHSVPVYVLPYADSDDEISLIDLWRMITARKTLILMSFIVTIMLASAYVFLVEPLYRAEAHLLPPQQRDIQGFLIDYRENIGPEITQYTPDIVYEIFLSNLKSKGLRREFFDKHNLSTHYDASKQGTEDDLNRIFDEKFNSRLTVEVDYQDTTFVTVSLGDRDPKLAALWLSQYIAFANTRTIDQLLSNVNAAIQKEIERVRYQLESKLKLASQSRRDSIIILQEALRVTRALGIENASALPMKSKKGPAVNTAAGLPLYMRGEEALEAEITVLKSRKSEEPFITGLRDLQEYRAFLEGISIASDTLTAVTVDEKVRIPYQSEKPRKILILMLASILGLIIGIFLVFISDFLSKVHSHSDND